MFHNMLNTLHSCHNFPAGSRQAARGARICETSLLLLYTTCGTNVICWKKLPMSIFSHKTRARAVIVSTLLSDLWLKEWIDLLIYRLASIGSQ